MRYEYPLTPDSWVFDVGAHKGDFAAGIYHRYGCNILCFEPMDEFYNITRERLAGSPKIRVIKSGIAGSLMYQSPVYKKGDMSGRFVSEPTEKPELCTMVTLKQALADTGLKSVDLLKLNIEGSEFEVLEHILEWNLQKAFRNIQVQFHDVIPSAKMRRESILEGFNATHEHQVWAEWVWENFKLR